MNPAQTRTDEGRRSGRGDEAITILDGVLDAYAAAIGQEALSVPGADSTSSDCAIIKGIDGKPLGNATVTCTADGDSFQSVTDSSGAVSITGVPYGDYRCEAVAPASGVSAPFTVTVDGGTAAAAVPQVQVPVNGSTGGSTGGSTARSTAGGGTLPSTGSDSTPLIAIASCFVLLGGTLTAARRRPARR